MLAVLDRDRDARLRHAIWVGLGTATFASVGLGIALFATVGDLHGRSRELVEGLLMWTAAGVLTYVLWWMGRRARASSQALREETRAVIGTGSALALLGLVFLTVFREGAETVLYLGAASTTTPVGAIGKGATIGLVAGYAVYRAVNGAQLLDELAAIQAQREVQRVKSDLIAAVSHELRTPLAFIKGYATTLLRDATADDATRRQFLEIIDDETTKLEGMVDELLDTSRLQSGRLEITPTELDLRPLIHDVAAKIRPHLATRGHELVVNEGPSLRAIADPLRVEQVLENLLENAARYSPPTAPIELDLRADERFVVVSVTDHGPGVPDDEHDRIFEPFFRGAAGRASTERGVGLGLAICSGLVEAQGGTLRVYSVPDGGARFAFSLPLA